MRGLKMSISIIAAGILLSSPLLLSACTSCSKQTATVKTDLSIAIRDPWLQKLVSATESVSLKGRGQLRSGKYQFQGKAITVSEDTNFDIDMSVNFDGKPVVSSSAINGALTLSKPVEYDKIPLPTKVQLKNGEATVEMDFARALFAALVNQLQQHQAASDSSQPAIKTELSDLPTNVNVSEAKLKIRTGAKLDLTGLSAVMSDDSYLLLERVNFTSKNEYSGSTTVNLNLNKDSQFNSNGVICGISSGKVRFTADISCANGKVSIAASDKPDSCVIEATGCSLKSEHTATPAASSVGTDAVHTGSKEGTTGASGSGETAFAVRDAKNVNRVFNAALKSAKISIDKLAIEKQLGKDVAANVIVNGKAALTNAQFDFSIAPHKVSGAVPGDSIGAMTFSAQGGKNEAGITIDNELVAKDFAWSANIDGNDFAVKLRETSIAHLTADTKSGIAINLESASVKPARLTWANKGYSVDVTLDPATRLSSAGPMEFAFANDKVTTPSAIPVKITAGDISIRDRKRNIYKLKRVNGICKASATGKGVHLTSDLSMNMSSNVDVFGIRGFNAQVGRLKIDATEQHAQLQLIDCVIRIPTDDLKKTIVAKLPNPYVKNVDELLLEKKKWRLRNFRIKKITVHDTKINQLNFQKVNEVQLDADANLSLSGNVEVYHQKFNPLSKQPSEWKQHDWEADAHVRENGIVDYKLVSGNTLPDSKIHLDANIKVGYPDKIAFDWSKVAGDTLAKAENQILQSAVSSAKTFAGDKTVSFKYTGEVPLCKASDQRLKEVKVKSLTVSPVGKDLAVKFTGAVNF
jgi:hypothetical protein